MIAFVQRFLQKHSKWVFVLLLFIIIIPFVFTIGNSPGIGWFRKNRHQQTFFGYDLNHQKNVRKWVAEATLSQTFQSGDANATREHFQGYFLMRLLNLHFADQFQIPQPSEARLKDFIRTRALFQDPKAHQFSLDAYQRYSKEKSPAELQLAHTVLSNDQRTEVIEKTLFRLPGYVLPYEAQLQWKTIHATWSLSMATLETEHVKNQVVISENQMMQFYTSHQERYQTPMMTEIAYLTFEAKPNAVGEPKESDLKTFFNENSMLFQKNGQVLTYDQAKNDVLRMYGIQEAEKAAETKASDFIFELYNKNIKHGSAALKDACKGYFKKTVQPFARGTIPAIENVSKDVLEPAILALSPSHYYSDPLKTDKGFIVLLFEKNHAAQQQPFASVKKQIHGDLVASETERLYQEAKTKIFQTLSGCKTAEDFKKKAADLHLKLDSFEKFSLSKTPEKFPSEIEKELPKLKLNKPSQAIDTNPKQCAFVFVSEKSIPNIKSDDDWKPLMKTQKLVRSVFGANELRSDWIEKGMQALQGHRATK